MNTTRSINETLARQMKESDWRALVSAIRNNKLIPVVGTDLMRVDVGGRTVTYGHYIAGELAARHDITDADLAALGTSLSEASLNDVVSICIGRKGDQCRFEIHDDVWQIINDSSIAPPRALTQLAAITDIKVFVTSTPDPLLERALRKAGDLETRVFRRLEEWQDLPKDARRRREHRFLYYLLGKAEPGTMDFAVCDEDLLRFVSRLHDTKSRPTILFDALRESNLLLLGVNFGDWLARFFLWMAKDRGNLSSEEARNLREYLADQKAGQDRPLVAFLQSFSQSTVIWRNQPEEFVDELHSRWSEQFARPAATTSEGRGSTAPSKMPRGSVFMSYSRSDQVAAECLYGELTRSGIPVWYDASLGARDEYGSILADNIENCSMFLPLVSAGALARDEGYFRKEWKKAVERDEKYFGSSRGCIVPVVIDEDDNILKQPNTYPGLPLRFRELQMYHCPGGRPPSRLITSLSAALPGAPGRVGP